MVAGNSAAYGKLDLAPDGHGAACWLRPGHTSLSAGRLLRLGLPRWRLWQSLARLGIGGARRLSALVAYADEQHHRAMPDAHWYLWALGVEPALQRQGLGTRLLSMGLARADSDRKPCYLETNNALNVTFYQRCGFRIVNCGQPAGHALTFWTMRRDLP
jgi:ribosomal protein S18 acetylase RimI-like enzyme